MNAMTRAALGIMISELGIWTSIRLSTYVLIRSIFDDPFKNLDKPSDTSDRLSRDQLRPAVLVYQYLMTKRDPTEALQCTELIVQASGRAFLRSLLDGLDLVTLVQSNDREVILRDRLKAIPNATFSLKFVEDQLHFTVSACHFVRLCHLLSHPELAPLFCSVDEAFFGHDLKGVHLERDTTLAQGGECCPFIFTLDDPQDKTH